MAIRLRPLSSPGIYQAYSLDIVLMLFVVFFPCYNALAPGSALLGTNLDLCVRLETIKLIEQLQHGPLYLPITSLLTVKPEEETRGGKKIS